MVNDKLYVRMSAEETNLELWKKKGLTLTDRLDVPTASGRSNVPQEVLDRKYERGDVVQQARLKFYPSIDISDKFASFYAGSFNGTREELEDRLFKIGYRNNPTAYVEVSERFGPDDGSFARNRITESQEFPYLGVGRPFGIVTWWNRVKEQVHVTYFIDEEMDLIHLAAHIEASAWLQPARHLTVSEGDGHIGVREFRQDWKDEYDEELDTVLGL